MDDARTATPPVPDRRGSPRVIIADAAFLGFMGMFGFAQDLQSYLFGAGRFGPFLLDDPRAIGFVEAHGLAAVIAVAAVVHARRNPAFWNGLLGSVHAFLGTCNLFFFQGFVEVGETRFAVAVTVIHFALAALNTAAISSAAPRSASAGDGADRHAIHSRDRRDVSANPSSRA